jgi:signal transduction histidine kinase
MRSVLYRIAQEAIANARKHADAGRVEVRLWGTNDGVTVRVRDDGRGFDPGVADAPVPGHLGLSTMVERAELLGGWCRITSAEGAGASVECWLPFERTEEAVQEPPPG